MAEQNKKKEYKIGDHVISEELSEEDRKMLSSINGQQPAHQMPILTEKIMVLTKKIEHFDKSTSKINKSLYVVTVILMMIAILQVMISAVQLSDSWWMQLVWIVVVILGVGYIFRVVFKEFYPDKKKQK